MTYQVTSLGVSVLALLRQRPMHGYEMLSTLTARHGDRMIKVRPGSLYHVVNRLAEEKLIRHTGTARNGNRPERTTYALTDAGGDALRTRLRELVAGPVNEVDKFVVALTEIHHLDTATAVAALQRRIAAVESTVAELTALRDTGRAPGEKAALDYILTTTAAQLDWLTGFVKSTESA